MFKPFFSNSLQDVVVAAVCVCGHLQTEHGSESKKVGNGKFFRAENEGTCCDKHCSCRRFVWAKWLTETDFVTHKNRKLAG